MKTAITKLIRKNVEYNGCEYVDALLLLHKASLLPNYSSNSPISYEIIVANSEKYLNKELINNELKLNNVSDLKHYVDDLLKKPELIKQRIQKFYELIDACPIKFENIVAIYISGKKNKHIEINKLNENIDKKQAKSDIYIEYACGDFVGWSCKQSNNATKSNYSVHKILQHSSALKLNSIKQEVLTNNGFIKFSKQDRDAVNSLFYPNKENQYWAQLRIELTNSNELVKSVLLDCLYGATLPYSVYEFDGTCITNNSKEGIDYASVIFEEYDTYYIKTNGEFRNAAKLFYKLVVGEKKYRVEIRWKGNIHSASPQFMIHNDS
jgi:hypothetical protein